MCISTEKNGDFPSSSPEGSIFSSFLLKVAFFIYIVDMIVLFESDKRLCNIWENSFWMNMSK